MIDWSGLYKWSMKYHDGTKPSENIKPMSEEDRKWLEEVMKHYTFDDASRLQEISKKLAEPATASLPEDDLLALLDELCEIVETHPQNGDNLCKAGGFDATF